MKSQNVKRVSSRSRGNELIWIVLFDLFFMLFAVGAIVELLNLHSESYKATLGFGQLVILSLLFVTPLVFAVFGCFAF